MDYEPPLLINARLNKKGEASFYSVSEDNYYVRYFPELHTMHIVCSHGGWFVLQGWEESFILNILTREKIHLPPIPFYSTCVLSSSKMDSTCRIIFFHGEAEIVKFSSCYLGDTEFIEDRKSVV